MSLLGCDAVCILYEQTFRRNVPPLSSGQKKYESEKGVSRLLFLTWYFLYPEDGGDTLLRKLALIRFTWRHIPGDGIIHSHRRENLKSYIKKVVRSSSLTCYLY
jgi:hypothetical protein